jgi:hypothetical protein
MHQLSRCQVLYVWQGCCQSTGILFCQTYRRIPQQALEDILCQQKRYTRPRALREAKKDFECLRLMQSPMFAQIGMAPLEQWQLVIILYMCDERRQGLGILYHASCKTTA